MSSCLRVRETAFQTTTLICTAFGLARLTIQLTHTPLVLFVCPQAARAGHSCSASLPLLVACSPSLPRLVHIIRPLELACVALLGAEPLQSCVHVALRVALPLVTEGTSACHGDRWTRIGAFASPLSMRSGARMCADASPTYRQRCMMLPTSTCAVRTLEDKTDRARRAAGEHRGFSSMTYVGSASVPCLSCGLHVASSHGPCTCSSRVVLPSCFVLLQLAHRDRQSTRAQYGFFSQNALASLVNAVTAHTGYRRPPGRRRPDHPTR